MIQSINDQPTQSDRAPYQRASDVETTQESAYAVVATNDNSTEPNKAGPSTAHPDGGPASHDNENGSSEQA